MKKFRITLFLTAIGAICIAFTLTSCSKEQSKFTIGVSQCSTDNWRETANLEMMREAAFLEDLDVEIRSVDDNSTKQIEDIEYFIKKGVDLINLIRLNKAIELMSNEHCNINETAFRCGFTSASYFSRTFQKYYNERPTAYIKRMNNSNK